MTTPAQIPSAVTYGVRHVTQYDYSAEVLQARHWLHLRPRVHAYQTLVTQRLSIEPQPVEMWMAEDAFGNGCDYANIDRPHAYLTVTSEFQVNVRRAHAPSASETPPWESVRDGLRYQVEHRSPDDLMAMIYRAESPHVRVKTRFADYARDSFTTGVPILEAAERLMGQIHRDMSYAPGTTTTTTPLIEVFERRTGVCQDYAHLMIGCLRALGLPARYVSGYLRTLPLTPGGSAELVGADASHAWVAVYVPDCGWVQLDPTNNKRVDVDHVALSWGRDFSDVSPLRGVINGGGEHRLSAAVQVVPLTVLNETPT